MVCSMDCDNCHSLPKFTQRLSRGCWILSGLIWCLIVYEDMPKYELDIR